MALPPEERRDRAKVIEAEVDDHECLDCLQRPLMADAALVWLLPQLPQSQLDRFRQFAFGTFGIYDS
jgi:hypothetical protein